MALAADDEEVYYRLMAEYCQWGTASNRPTGFAELGTAATTERARMDALGVITYTAIGFEPLLPGQAADQRVPQLLRAECDLTLLTAAVGSRLEDLS